MGVLRTRLGWLVVLGPSRECIFHAVAMWNCADSFIICDRKTRKFQNLDRAAIDNYFFAFVTWNLSCSFRGVDVGPCIRYGSRERCIYPRVLNCSDRGVSAPICLAST